MRILITEVTGFAGTHLANLLAEESHDLDLYGTYCHSGRNSLLEISREIKLLECDVNYFQSVEQVMESVLPDLFFHFAAYVSVAKSFEHPALTLDTNVIGTMNLLEAVRKICRKAKILIPGSAEAYGRVGQKDMPIKETQALKPQNPYGLSKAMQEMLGLYYHNTFGLKTIRCWIAASTPVPKEFRSTINGENKRIPPRGITARLKRKVRFYYPFPGMEFSFVGRKPGVVLR